MDSLRLRKSLRKGSPVNIMRDWNALQNDAYNQSTNNHNHIHKFSILVNNLHQLLWRRYVLLSHCCYSCENRDRKVLVRYCKWFSDFSAEVGLNPHSSTFLETITKAQMAVCCSTLSCWVMAGDFLRSTNQTSLVDQQNLLVKQQDAWPKEAVAGVCGSDVILDAASIWKTNKEGRGRRIVSCPRGTSRTRRFKVRWLTNVWNGAFTCGINSMTNSEHAHLANDICTQTRTCTRTPHTTPHKHTLQHNTCTHWLDFPPPWHNLKHAHEHMQRESCSPCVCSTWQSAGNEYVIMASNDVAKYSFYVPLRYKSNLPLDRNTLTLSLFFIQRTGVAAATWLSFHCDFSRLNNKW